MKEEARHLADREGTPPADKQQVQHQQVGTAAGPISGHIQPCRPAVEGLDDGPLEGHADEVELHEDGDERIEGVRLVPQQHLHAETVEFVEALPPATVPCSNQERPRVRGALQRPRQEPLPRGRGVHAAHWRNRLARRQLTALQCVSDKIPRRVLASRSERRLMTASSRQRCESSAANDLGSDCEGVTSDVGQPVPRVVRIDAGQIVGFHV
mmetsp:Transcript_54761/g.157475  ORF Transcript_54761/g.157475 Transcript_54761/m.157475 type:complete len:211 (+) Transcript_54761:1844-2476(+)